MWRQEVIVPRGGVSERESHEDTGSQMALIGYFADSQEIPLSQFLQSFELRFKIL